MTGTRQPRSRMRRMSARPSLRVRLAKRVGQAQVDDHQVRGSVLEAALGLLRGERDLHLVAGDFEELLTEIELYCVVVNDENAGHLGACLS